MELLYARWKSKNRWGVEVVKCIVHSTMDFVTGVRRLKGVWRMDTANELSSFYAEIKGILQQARSRAQTAVNSAMVEAYWLIGRRIVEEEQQGEARAKYGKGILKNLATALSAECGIGASTATA